MQIDWNKQWELYAPNFRGGFLCVEPYGFRLKPGPGFGDLSHPTTRLMLSLMPDKISLPVVDIGCGSGVLSLAAWFAGAPKVYGIDRDEGAIEHARVNAKLNHADIFFGKVLPEIPKRCLVLMNMISSEQRVAWEAHKNLHPYVEMMVVSGIPIEEKGALPYETLVEVEELEGWLGFKYEKEESIR